MLSDEELANNWKQGDQNAFAALYHRYERRLYNFAVRTTGNADIAEDIRQETFLKANHAIRSFRGGKFSIWLYRIASNLCTDYGRTLKRKPDSIDELDLEPTSASLDVEIVNKVWTSKILTALNSMPAHYRVVIALRHFEDMTYDEIAEVIKSTPRSVAVQLHRARQILKERLIGLGLSPEGFENELQTR